MGQRFKGQHVALLPPSGEMLSRWIHWNVLTFWVKLRNQPVTWVFPASFSLDDWSQLCLAAFFPFGSHNRLSWCSTKRSRSGTVMPLRTWRQDEQSWHVQTSIFHYLQMLFLLTVLPSLKQYVTLGCRSGILREGEILLGNIDLLFCVQKTQKCILTNV